MPKLKSPTQKINGWNIEKKDNAGPATKAKIELRARVLEKVGADRAHVFDAYAGHGGMYAAVWCQAASYVGCDENAHGVNLRHLTAIEAGTSPTKPGKRLDTPLTLDQTDWPERQVYFGDNRRIMRCLDLRPFNIFDFDAYGSPWEPIYLMIRRRPVAPGECIGMVLTEGQGMKMCMGGMSVALGRVAGVRHAMPGMGAAQQSIIDRALMRTGLMMNATIEHLWQTVSKNSSTIRYIGLVLRGNEQEPADDSDAD